MAMTFLLSVIMMAGLFLMLYSGVGLIQDRRFFTSRTGCGAECRHRPQRAF